MLREYQEALQAAIIAVSESQLGIVATRDNAALARRIEFALTELDKLRLGQVPDYSHPDVALFYSHWYLPEQVNLAYSESSHLLNDRRAGVHGNIPMQLVDFGAGSGAMILGLTLAIAHHVPHNHWPEIVGVYQIDVPAMLALGDEIWQALAAETRRYSALGNVTALLSRTLFERTGTLPSAVEEWNWARSERWLSALHVVYEESIEDTFEAHQQLRIGMRPHASLVTAPQLKESRIANARAGHLYLTGAASKIREHREALLVRLEGHLSSKATNYLRSEVRWASRYGGKRPVANTAVRDRTMESLPC